MIHDNYARPLPLNVGSIHFVGIGGIGMSGIAEILYHLGYTVQGSDIAENQMIHYLRDKGISVTIGHDKENIKGATVVVKSTAITERNPEILEAYKLSVPVVNRSEMLAELMRLKFSVAIAGTHGKTTTTSLTAAMFEIAGKDPTVINGGVITAKGTNAYLGKGEWLIAEADESDGTFVRIPSTIGVVTNIDPEHLDFYGSFDAVKEAFYQFISNLPFYGFGVLCKDHPEVAALIPRISNRKVRTYALQAQADVRACNIRRADLGSLFDVKVSARMPGGKRTLKDVYIPMLGEHNVQNALAPITIALELGFDDDLIIKGFSDFKGVKRRFTHVGEVDSVRIIDDYAHHPTEITATLKTARHALYGTPGRLVAVFQPHRYSRFSDLFESFADALMEADILVIADVYAAGEAPLDGVSKEHFVKLLNRLGKQDVYSLESEEKLAALISTLINPHDLVLCMGAGSITRWAYALPEQLKEHSSQTTLRLS